MYAIDGLRLGGYPAEVLAAQLSQPVIPWMHQELRDLRLEGLRLK